MFNDLLFTGFEIVAVVLAVLSISSIADDGETHWMEGVQLFAVYVILDPLSDRYGLLTMRQLRVGGVLIVGVLGLLIGHPIWPERRSYPRHMGQRRAPHYEALQTAGLSRRLQMGLCNAHPPGLAATMRMAARPSRFL